MTEDRDEEHRGFKVHDRRRFAESGEPRQAEVDQPDQAATEPAPAQTSQPSEETSGPRRDADSDEVQADESRHQAGEHLQGEHLHDEHHDDAEQHQHDGQPGEITFATFIISLSTQALALLGEIPDPSGAIQVDLGAARQLIDILGMLESKTRGNLDADEGTLLEHALYDLRMKYVECANKA